ITLNVAERFAPVQNRTPAPCPADAATRAAATISVRAASFTVNRVLRSSGFRDLPDPTPNLGAPALLLPRQVDQREQAPEVVQLPVADVLDDGVEQHPEHLAALRVALEVELLEGQRGDRQHDPEQERDHEERDEEEHRQVAEQIRDD